MADHKDLLGKLAAEYGPRDEFPDAYGPASLPLAEVGKYMSNAKLPTFPQPGTIYQAYEQPQPRHAIVNPTPYLLVYYSAGIYQWGFCDSSEAAVSEIQKLQQVQEVQQVMLYSLEDCWKKEWQKK